MPTRIVLTETVASRQNIPRFRSTNSRSSTTTDVESAVVADENKTRGNDGSAPSRNNESSSTNKRKNSRKVVQLKSSFIRNKKDIDNFRALSSEDIRASPRLLGYCFQLLASIVMLISVSAFHREDKGDNATEIWDIFNNNRTRGETKEIFYFNDETRVVFAWKLIGCFVVSGFGTIVTLGIILVHFDTICFPSFWRRTFQDGSRREQVLMLLLVIFWGLGLHVNTSSLSVGESQANVFFTTWISFFSAVLNYGIWRISAGRRSIANMINEHHRETTYNWLWVLFCSLIFAGAMCDTFVNREYIKLYFEGEELNISEKLWIYMMIIPWGCVLVSTLSIILNHFLRKSCELRVCRGSFVLLGWRQAEGFVAFVITCILFWIVFQYTGGNGVYNGLNNVYFGVWGAFINSVLLLATWLRENKNIDSIIKEERNRDEQSDIATSR